MSNFHIHPPRAPLPRHFTKPSFWKIHEIRISFLTIPFLIFCFNRKIILYISWNPKQNVYFANSLTGVPTPVLQHIVHIRIRGKGYTTLYQICYGLNSLSHLLQSLNICTVLHFLLSPFFLAPPFTFLCLYYLLSPFFALPPFTLFCIRLPFTFLCTVYFLLSPYFVLPFSTFLCTSSFYISLNFLLLPYIVLPPLTFLCASSFHLTLYFSFPPVFVLPSFTFLCTSSFNLSLCFLLSPFFVLSPFTFSSSSLHFSEQRRKMVLYVQNAILPLS